MTERSIERALRRLVRERVNADPGLRAERARMNSGRSEKAKILASIAFFLCCVFMVIYSIFATRIEAGLPASTALALYGILIAWIQGGLFWNQIYQSYDLAALSLLPIPDREVYKRQMKVGIRQATLMFAFVAAPLIAFGVSTSAPDTYWLAFPFILALHAAIVTALSIALVFLQLLRVAFYVSLSVVALGISLIVARGTLASDLNHYLERAYPWTSRILPNGWVDTLIQKSLIEGDATGMYFALPIALLLAAAVQMWRRMQATYVSPVWDFFAGEDINEEQDEVLDYPYQPDEIRNGLEDEIRENTLSVSMNWHDLPFLDRVVGRWMTEEERVVVEFMLCGKPEISRKLTVGVVCIAAGFPLVLSNINWLIWVGSMLFVAGGFSLLPWLGGSWPGTNAIQNFGVKVPAYAHLPIGYDQFRSVFMKYNLYRCLLALPVAAATGFILSLYSAKVPDGAAWMPVKIQLVAAAAQPIVFIFCVSSGTNDTQRFRLHTFALVLSTVMAFALAVGAVAVPNAWVSAGCITGLTLLGLVTNTFYRRQYNRMKFDLIVSGE
ncbi:MAG: hypothetical protein AMXMBFR84_06470 [Candidatus Hydrogenedentota bacterium]